MHILEQIHETTLPKINFFERKIKIKNPNIILYGPPKSGKSYLIYDYLSSFTKEQYLYIDFNDYRNSLQEIEEELENFIIQSEIELLVLESFSFSFDLPKVATIITIDRNIAKDCSFEKLYVPTLDFEEYLLFDTKHNNLVHSFNSFLKYGSFPEILEFSEQKKHIRNLEICKLYAQDRTYFEILFLIVKFAGEKKSVFQLFNTLKKDIKISKDKFYKVFDAFNEEGIIHLCPKFDQPKAVKKIFVFNHALLDIVSYKKSFNNLFKNMVFLELVRRVEDIYYLDHVDFYIPESDQIVLAIPFFNSLVSSNIISKLLPYIEQYNIKVITIVTVSTEQSIFIDDLEAMVLPFYNWVLTL
jgi:uncharacterized protein